MVRIGLLAVALTVTALFAGLGMWQLDRAEQKRTAFAEFEARGNAPRVDLNLYPNLYPKEGVALPGYRAAAAGRYRDATILLDNQVHQGHVGYLVYTAFELDGRAESVLVNRGWISAGADRSASPDLVTPTSSQRLGGRLSLPPQGGLRLAGSDRIERLADGIWRVQAIDFAALATHVGRQLTPITLLLDADAPDGFVRDWTKPGSTRGDSAGLTDENRHLGYAFQWFALAITVVVVTILLTLRSRRTTP